MAPHYAGAGGIGKTTLLRLIMGRLALPAGAPPRVDFDNLNPNYPARRPAELLVQLAEGLRPYANAVEGGSRSRLESRLDDFSPGSPTSCIAALIVRS